MSLLKQVRNQAVETAANHEGGGYKNAPDGIYPVMIIASEETEYNGMPYIKMKGQIEEGDYEGANFFIDFRIMSDNPKVQEIALENLTRLCIAAELNPSKMGEEYDVDEFINKSALVKQTSTPNPNNPDKDYKNYTIMLTDEQWTMFNEYKEIAKNEVNGEATQEAKPTTQAKPVTKTEDGNKPSFLG